jgi:hypothetical protein
LPPVIENHVGLAVAEAPLDRFAQVDRLADILWQEIVRQVETESTQDLDALGKLYGETIRRGLPRCAFVLSPEEAESRASVAVKLRQRQAEANRVAQVALPTMGDLLRELGGSSADSARRILAGERPDGPAEAPWAVGGRILAATVVGSLKLAEERDPLRRADICNDVAESLSELIVFTAWSGEEETAGQLGHHLNEVVDRGVKTNLARYQASGPDDSRKAEYERVAQRGQHSIEVLQRNLERAPPAARKGLQRALEAKLSHGKGPPAKGDSATPGRGKGKGHSQSKATRDATDASGGDRIPPGLLKKSRSKE